MSQDSISFKWNLLYFLVELLMFDVLTFLKTSGKVNNLWAVLLRLEGGISQSSLSSAFNIYIYNVCLVNVWNLLQTLWVLCFSE